MKFAPIILICIITGFFLFYLIKPDNQPITAPGADIYQYVEECKAELGISRALPQLSCLDGEQVPIYVDREEIQEDNWEELSTAKKCDNPHWLGGDMGCWTYSHLQVLNLDDDNIMVLNCRQKGNQLKKNWFRKTSDNLGMNQQQRKEHFEVAVGAEKIDRYYLYNTFNDIGIILRNTKTGKSCYITQYGEAVVGFLPPLDEPLPEKTEFLKRFNPEQARPPKDFPQQLWYRNANQAFRSPAFTASAGCIDCHNAHGVKYSPYINSKHGLPSIYAMAQLPFLPVGEAFINHYREARYRQVSTDPIDGKQQLCTQCHNITTQGTCGPNMEQATGHPDPTLSAWLTPDAKTSWMPPMHMRSAVIKKHIAALKCCCQTPDAKGCRTREFGPTENDLPAGFKAGKGWVSGQEPGMCQDIINSFQWNAEEF